MIRIDAEIEAGEGAASGAELLLTVHDELVFEVPLGQVTGFSAWAKAQMEAVYPLKVPLVVEVAHGHTWGEAHA